MNSDLIRTQVQPEKWNEMIDIEKYITENSIVKSKTPIQPTKILQSDKTFISFSNYSYFVLHSFDAAE